jgi:hypothetical protein
VARARSFQRLADNFVPQFHPCQTVWIRVGGRSQPVSRASAIANSGDGDETAQQSSRFLPEIPGDLLNQSNSRPSNSYQ